MKKGTEKTAEAITFTITKLLNLLKVFWNIAQWLFIIGALLMAISWSVPQLRSFLLSKGWLSADASLGIVAVLVSVVFIVAKEISTKSKAIIDELEDAKINRDRDIIQGGTTEIYNDIVAELSARKNVRKMIEVDLLGYTLFSVFWRLRAWLRDGLLQSLVLNLYSLDKDFVLASPAINSAWAVDCQNFSNAIREFIRENEKELSDNKVEIHIFHIRHIPAVHGFRIGNGTLFISFATWHKGKIDEADRATFERVSPTDRSTHAEMLRSLFDNWIEAAKTYQAQGESSSLGPKPA